MAQIIGKKWVCEKCRREVFLECTDVKSLDGGFTKQYIYAALPEGWGVGIIGHQSVELSRSAEKNIKGCASDFLRIGVSEKHDTETVYETDDGGGGVSRNVAREVVKTIREMSEAEDKILHYKRIDQEYRAFLAAAEYEILKNRLCRWLNVTIKMQQEYAEKNSKVKATLNKE